MLESINNVADLPHPDDGRAYLANVINDDNDTEISPRPGVTSGEEATHHGGDLINTTALDTRMCEGATVMCATTPTIPKTPDPCT